MGQAFGDSGNREARNAVYAVREFCLAARQVLARLMVLVAALCGVTGEALAQAAAPTSPITPAKPVTMADILAASPAADWRPLDPENTLYLDLETPDREAGRVVIELAPGFAPRHVEAIRSIARAGAVAPTVNRVQDNFVTQWQLTTAEMPALKAEFTRKAGADLRFTPLPDRDAYAPEVGFVDGFPAARDRQAGAAWLVHCYGMVAVGRENAANSGNGAELYTVIGQAPRQLDRNMTVVGRIVSGVDLLSALPRGKGAMGFYKVPQSPINIRAVRLAADMPAAEREALEVLRTDSATFKALVEARRNRHDAFYHVPANAIDICNVPLPVREGR
ncbi:MAG TPA: peptidylprolyl isomerase [Pedomonas sp.]|uniref:peptidylprolyl isomerase n=1 Tax=Pedomonas sp. TaxID=2976421 RepID=UPI002F417B28